MKKILFLIMAVLSAMYAYPVDNYHLLERVRLGGGKILRAPDNRGVVMLPAIVEVDDKVAVDSLVSLGVVVFHVRDNLALVCIPEDMVDRVTTLEDVRRVCYTPTSVPVMDRAKQITSVDDVHAGVDLPHAYKGSGVVVGICDIGFDPSHTAFRNPETGMSTVSRIYSYKETSGLRRIVNPCEYETWVTDTTDTFHATHVAGIMAGSSPDYSLLGVAPGADLVVSVSELSDVGILAGAEDIISYADSVGKPAVINMSLGSYTGPHDGSTLFNEYLSKLGEKAVICIASGNEGNTHCSMAHRFKSDSESAEIAIYGTDWVNFSIDGFIDLWSDTGMPLDVSVGVVDVDTRKIIYSTKLELSEHGKVVGITSSESVVDDAMALNHDPTFSRYLDGMYIAMVDNQTRNGRFNVTLRVNTRCESVSEQGEWARYVPALVVRGVASQLVNGYADCSGTMFASLPGGAYCGSDMSVSDLACGDNVVCVGMYTSRSSVTVQSGSVVSASDFVENEVNPNSGYGVINGSSLPHVCAPGAFIISAMSRPYVEKNESAIKDIVYTTVDGGSTSYWTYECGTSMATPFVAGTIALWLEECPWLGVDEIYDVISATNKPSGGHGDCRDVNGWINPVGGLRYIMEKYADVRDISVDEHDERKISIIGNSLVMSIPVSSDTSVRMYNVAGVLVHESIVPIYGDMVDLSDISSGLYIVECDGKVTKLLKKE